MSNKIVELEAQKKKLENALDELTPKADTITSRELNREITKISCEIEHLYNLDHVNEALSYLSFADDEISQIETTACNKDNALVLVGKLKHELNEFVKWQKTK